MNTADPLRSIPSSEAICRRLSETEVAGCDQIVFYVNCRFCHVPIEISGTDAGPDCSKLRNVCRCGECDEQFYFDACEVNRESQREMTPSPAAHEADPSASSTSPRRQAEIEIVLPASDESVLCC